MPQAVLGAWLAVVPDRFAFTASQIAVLAHVGFGLVTLPVFALWVWAHATRQPYGLGSIRSPGARLVVGVGVALAVAAALAIGSGFGAAWAGEGTALSWWHRALGLGAMVPLVIHLAAGRQRLASAVVALAGAAIVLGAITARGAADSIPAEPIVPAFSRELRPVDRYEPSAWCGECHTGHYEEWQRSAHARTLTSALVRSRLEEAIRDDGIENVDADLARGELVPSCSTCHAPVSFYGDDPSPMLESGPPVRDGISCSFCHTLRDTRGLTPEEIASAIAARRAEAQGLERAADALVEAPDELVRVPRVAYYVSAPETVRRYLGQGSGDPWLEEIAGWLIRWRPEMHRRDYEAPLLRSSEACAGCHHETYRAWSESRFAREEVGCSDCHMVDELDGRPAHQSGLQVPWGEARPRRRTHVFAGGNVQLGRLEGDARTAADQRRVARRGLRVDIVGLAAPELADGESLRRVQARVASELIGHGFPAGEFGGNVAWVELQAIGPRGEVRRRTAAPQQHDNGDRAFDFERRSLAIEDEDPIPSGGERTFELGIDVAGLELRALRVAVFHTFDDEPIAAATLELRARDRPSSPP